MKTFSSISDNSTKKRLVAAASLQITALFVGMFFPDWDYGLYDDTKFWYAMENMSHEFLFVSLPTIALLFLIPVFWHGTSRQRFIAIVLSVFPTVIGVSAWYEIARRFRESVLPNL
jgi:hypothetical protein